MIRTAASIGLLLAGIAGGMAQNAAQATIPVLPQLYTNETEIVEATQPSTLAINDPVAVFSYVLNSLPDRVKVYPTENYYYFRFTHNGTAYTGNIRLGVTDRDQGKVNFVYGEAPSDWRIEPPFNRVVLDKARGVMVEKVEPLVYRITHAGKSVLFALNDMSQIKPPPNLLTADETYLGPIFDESGVRFFLVFNTKLKVFHYLLDETVKVADDFFPVKSVERVLVGKRTGFAFYNDTPRRILIGTFERNSQLNTYFDGPFDQLPDNFIEGESLRDAILAVSPDVKGKIDRFGYFSESPGNRYLIHPYLIYRTEGDLALFHRCMTDKRVPEADRPRCFVIPDDEAPKAFPQPLAMKNLPAAEKKPVPEKKPAAAKKH